MSPFRSGYFRQRFILVLALIGHDATETRPGLRTNLDGAGPFRVEIDYHAMLVEPPFGKEFIEQLRRETPPRR